MAALARVVVIPMAAVALVGFGVFKAAGAESLNEALAEAYRGNPTLLAARAELRGVNERVPQELSNYRPSAFVDGQAGVERIDSEPSSGGAKNNEPWEVLLDVEQPLYRGGRTVNGVAQAEAEVQGQRARLKSVEQQVLLSAVRAYMDVWRDEAVLQLNINNEKVLTRQLEDPGPFRRGRADPHGRGPIGVAPVACDGGANRGRGRSHGERGGLPGGDRPAAGFGRPGAAGQPA
jgi:outer membrane protein TolC